MKKIIILLFVLTSFYAQAESNQKVWKNKYFNINLASDFFPDDNSGFFLGIPNAFFLDARYGGYITQQSFAEVGFSLRNNHTTGKKGEFFFGPMVKYNYDFTKDSQWIPGLDIVLLIGSQGHKTDEELNYFLVMSLEFGLYIRLVISKSYVILLKSGYSTLIENFETDETEPYTRLVMQWFF